MKWSRFLVGVAATISMVLLVWSASTGSANGTQVVVTIGDSDGIVAPGSEFDAYIWSRNPAPTTYLLQYAHAVGGPFVIDPMGVRGRPFSGQTVQEGEQVPTVSLGLVVPQGTPHGEATIWALVDTEDEPAPGSEDFEIRPGDVLWLQAATPRR